MQLVSIILSLMLVLPFSTKAQNTNDSNASELVINFVQGFYDWYVHKALGSRSVPAWDAAIKSKKSYFSPELRRNLLEDSEAQEKAVGEIVGLDFDPFLNDQDPGTHYIVGNAVPAGDDYNVGIHRSFAGKPEEKIVVTAEVAIKDRHLYFVNFVYPNAQDLLGVLKALRDIRNKPNP